MLNLLRTDRQPGIRTGPYQYVPSTSSKFFLGRIIIGIMLNNVLTYFCKANARNSSVCQGAVLNVFTLLGNLHAKDMEHDYCMKIKWDVLILTSTAYFTEMLFTYITCFTAYLIVTRNNYRLGARVKPV